MAITAAMRTDIIELAVIANDAAPGQTLLAELVALANAGSSLTAIAEHLTARSAFTSTYPTTQTANEFGVEWIANLLPEASAALQAECVVIVEAHINGGGSIASLLVSVQEFMSAASETDANLGTLIAGFNHKVEVATYHTITKEAAAEWSIPSTVTSTESTVATGKAAVDTALTPAAAATATFSLAADGSTVSEGGDVVFTLTTTNVAAGTEYAYVISGVNSSDLSAGTLTGLAEVDSNGKATVSVGLKSDTTTEGAETLTMTVAGETSSVTVTDSSTTPAAATTATATYSLAADSSTVSEGGDVVFTLTTTNVTAGTEFAYVISGVNSADLSSGSLTGLAEVDSDGKATVSVGLKNDTTTEGAETMTMTVASQTASVTVTDSSTTAAAATAATYTLSVTGGSVDEGDSGTANLVYSLSLDSAAAADVVVNYETVSGGTATAGTDYDSTSGAVTFSTGQQNASVTIKVNGDTTFESDETISTTFTGSSLTASVSAVSATITNDDTDPDTVAQAKTLTTGTDSFTTGSGDDTFDASTSGSLDTVDTIVGGTGADVLTVAIANESIRPDITGVETIKITAAADTGTIDTRDMTGVTNYDNESSAGNTVLNYLSTVPTVTLNTLAADMTLNFTDAALADASQSMTLNTNNSTGTITVTDGGGTTNELETVVINSTSLASTITALVTDGVETSAVTITGDADLTVSSLDALVATLTSSAFTGDLTLTSDRTLAFTATTGAGADTITSSSTAAQIISTGAGNDSYTGGSTAADSITLGAGTDSVTIATANLTSVDTIAGGAGTDSIIMSDAATVVDADFTLVTGVETVSSGTNNLTLTLGTASQAAGVTTVTDGTGVTSLSIGAGHTGNVAVSLSTGNDVINATVAANDLYTGALTVTMAGASLTTNDTITGGTGSDNLKVTGTASNAGLTKVTNFETITANDTTTGVSITIDELTVADGKTLHVDGSGLTTGVLTANLADDTNGINTVTGGGAADAITLSSSDLGDTITGGAGNDNFTLDAAADLTSLDTITGGAGTDIITMGATGTIIDSDFTNVTTVETLTGSAGDDTITLGPLATAAGIVTVNNSGGTDSVTIPATHTGDVTVVAGGVDTIAAAATYAGKLTVKSTAALQVTDTLTGGAGTSDTFIVTADDAGGLAETDTDSITLFENVDLAFNGDFSYESDTLNIATGKSMSYTGSGQTTGAVTFILSDETDTTSSQTVSLGGTGAHIITLGSGTDSYTYTYSGTGTHGVQTVTATAGTNTITTLDAADIITMGSGADTISSGAAIDTISVATANLASTDTINAGAGVDILSMTDASTVIDSDFTNITNLETIKQTTSAHAMTLTLGAASMASGLVTVTSGTGDSTIVVGAGHTSALAVTLATGTDSIVGSASAAALTVSITETGLESGDTITGGTGSDILAITGDGDTLAAADMAGVTLVETIKSVGNTALTIETHANNVAASGALTMDGSTLTTGILTFDGTNEGATTPGAFTITTLGTGGHIITLGSGNDTYTGTGSGDTTITATAGTNTITTGSGADSITLGTGVDTVTGGSGIDTITTATANLVSTDTIAGGAGVDIIALSDASTIVDADFTNVTTVETLTLHTGNDTATLGAASSAAGIVTVNPGTGTNTVTIGAGHTGDLTVALSTGVDTIAAGSYTGALTVTAAENSITAADTITGGTGSDTLTITGGGAGLTAAELAAVTKIETFKAASNAAQTIVMSDNNVAAGGSLTYNAAAMTGSVLTFTGSAETDGSYTITTLGTGAHIIVLGNGSDTYTSTNTAGVNTVTATAGNNTITTAAGADIITLGSGSDTVTTGAAADIIITSSANLNLNDTIAGGAGTDILKLSTDGSVVIDADFTNVTAVETLTLSAADLKLTATLGALAAAAGIVTVTDTDTSADGTFSLTVAAGFTNNLSVTIANDAAVKTIDATNYTKVLTINASDADLDGSASVFTGGTGTSDELKVTATGQTITTGIASMTAIEKITTVAAAGALTMVLADGNIASGKTLTIDGTSLDGDTLTVDASAETNGTVTVNVSNAVAGAHVITLGAGADTHSGALGTGVQTVTATGGNNTITTGTAVDIINVGTGQDTITVNAGTANTINFTLSTHLVANSATVTDWTATKGIITFDVADLNAGATLQNIGSADDAVAGDTGIEIITGATDLSAADDSDIILIADLTTAISSSDALETALEYGGALQLTMARALAVGDRFLVAYDDNVSSYVAMVTMNTTAPDNGYFGVGSLTAVTLVKLTGVTEASVAIAVGDVDLE
jgi:hypothetical protein